MHANWQILDNLLQIESIKSDSFQNPIAIFKHSTRCSISSVALNRLERAGLPSTITWFYLDLLKHREISNSLAEIFAVYHESPQILLIKNGECIYDNSHNGINIDELQELVNI
jgi:bacillithiol system protein YtxJ